MKSERAGGTWLLLAVLALIWGSSFILMKRGLYHEGIPVLTPWQMATARLSIAWLALSPLLLRHASLLRKHWRPMLGSGLLGNGLPALLFATAQTRIDSALSGMLNSLTPLMTLLTGLLFFATPARLVHFMGIGLGLLGAAGLVFFAETDGLGGWSWFALLPVLGTLGYGLSGNIVKRHLLRLAGPGACGSAGRDELCRGAGALEHAPPTHHGRRGQHGDLPDACGGHRLGRARPRSA